MLPWYDVRSTFRTRLFARLMTNPQRSDTQRAHGMNQPCSGLHTHTSIDPVTCTASRAETPRRHDAHACAHGSLAFASFAPPTSTDHAIFAHTTPGLWVYATGARNEAHGRPDLPRVRRGVG